ncbi:MAG: hypothetical protein KDA86_03660 [Planctomycetaceae bacterium]|nr:hypothetical protein [Planctomycetaceae bacterium]
MAVPGLMSVKEWKDKTSILFSIRGPRLRAVDSALNQYHEVSTTENLVILMSAVEIYRSTREGGFETYCRNKGHIFEVLMSQIFNLASADDQIMDLAQLPFFGIESWAVQGVETQDLADAIKAERQHRLKQLLQGQTLKFRWDTVAWREAKIFGRGGIQRSHESIHSSGNGNSVVDVIAGKAGSAGSSFLSACGIPTPDLTELVPFFGVIYDGLKTAWQWKKYLDMTRDKAQFPGYLQACSGQATDIRAAIAAVQAYLEKRMEAQKDLVEIQTATFGAKLLTLLADGGVGSHAALTQAKAMVKAYITFQFALDEHKEMQEAQPYLNSPDAGIFKVCPLLGCYMVTACDHSDLLNMFDDRRQLSKYWQFEAMHYIENVNKLRSAARDYMGKSNIELLGAPTEHNTIRNKLRWMGEKTKVALGRVDHRKALASGRAISSDSDAA